MVVGDQLFTDILGANRAGLESILVKYIGYYKKEKKGIRRNLEKVLLWFYGHSRFSYKKKAKTLPLIIVRTIIPNNYGEETKIVLRDKSCYLCYLALKK